jgi:hypothetical protein
MNHIHRQHKLKLIKTNCKATINYSRNQYLMKKGSKINKTLLKNIIKSINK